MRKKLPLIALYSFFFGGLLSATACMTWACWASWSGGELGGVMFYFNTMHERLLESILFPVWIVGGFICMVRLIIYRVRGIK